MKYNLVCVLSEGGLRVAAFAQMYTWLCSDTPSLHTGSTGFKGIYEHIMGIAFGGIVYRWDNQRVNLWE